MQPRFYKRLYRQRKINAVLFLFRKLRPYLGKACKLILHILFGGHARTGHLRLRPHVSGYFWIRNFFFPDTLSVHTHSVNPAYESATFWICSPEWKFLITLWILNRVDAKLNPDTFLIRWRKKIEPSSLPWILLKMATSLPGSLYTRRCKLRAVYDSCSVANIPRVNLDTCRICVDRQIRFEYQYVCTWKFLNLEGKSSSFFKIFGYLWTGLVFCSQTSTSKAQK